MSAGGVNKPNNFELDQVDFLFKNNGITLQIGIGSIIQFNGDCIVNAANMSCQGGGGVDGAITRAGGDALAKARKELPIINNNNDRCATGHAVITIAGDLPAKFVIHAVGPDFRQYSSIEKAKEDLKKAYTSSLDLAATKDIASIGFSLISSGIFCGEAKVDEVLACGIEACRAWINNGSNKKGKLKKIVLICFNDDEYKILSRKFTLKIKSKELENGTTFNDIKAALSNLIHLDKLPVSGSDVSNNYCKVNFILAADIKNCTDTLASANYLIPKGDGTFLKLTLTSIENKPSTTLSLAPLSLTPPDTTLSLVSLSPAVVYSPVRPDDPSKLISSLKDLASFSDSTAAAGIFVYQFDLCKKKIETLMGLARVERKLSFLGGKKDKGDSSIIDCAVREFYEESGGLISDTIRKRLIQRLKRDWDGSIHACWISKGKYVMFMLSVDTIKGFREELSSICQKFDEFKNSTSPRHLKKGDAYREMNKLEWKSVETSTSGPHLGKSVSDFAKVVLATPIFSKWLHNLCNDFPSQVISVLINNFKERAMAGIEKAKQEKKEASEEIENVKDELPPVNEPDIPPVTDIQVIDENSEEYKAAMKRLTHPLVYPSLCIKKINVPARVSKFNAYVEHHLPATHRLTKESFHGTPHVAWANTIALTGPDISRPATNGKALGQGFYTATDSNTSEGYATMNGALCLCKVAPGRTIVGHGNQLKQGESDSVTTEGQYPWHVLFHPDAVIVEYIIDHGQDSDKESVEQTLRRQAYEKAVKERDVKEQIRKAVLVKMEAVSKMCDYFKGICDEIVNELPVSAENLSFLVRKFELEEQQFDQKLPMYARKEEFLGLLRDQQSIVLKGGTGIGKTVTVPQWCFDNVLCDTDRTTDKPVAVLVPRKAIAIGLANYISEVRKTKVGLEVGLGTGDSCKLGPETRVAFFTYGFFAAISKSDKNFSKWGCVILDEAHERNPDADSLLLLLSLACRCRPDFKLVVMSATIDVTIFAKKIQWCITSNPGNDQPAPVPYDNNFPEDHPNCPVIEVPGVTFPVEDIWWNGAVWDPSADGANRALCIETLRIFNKEEGNVLIFLPTIRDVTDCCEIMIELLKHDENTSVLPLYASLEDWEREDVVDFCKVEKNKGRRLICFSTNVAEAGVTIPGLSAVVETGREIIVTYSITQKANVAKLDWISKASQMQRRGRAGRTAPGRCYCMYSKSDYEEKMPEYSVPTVLKMNCESFYLGLVVGGDGMDPCDLPLLDNPRDRMEAARDSLESIGAITVDKSEKAVKATELGLVISSLPLSISMSKCIVTAAWKGCGDEMAVIACLSQCSERASLFLGDAAKVEETRKKFDAGSGDFELSLNVYEEWQRQDLEKSRDWCRDEGVNFQVLEAADDLLTKVRKALTRCSIPLSTMRKCDDRSKIIQVSIISSFPDNLALAKNPAQFKDGFMLVSGYDSSTVTAVIHPKSVMSKSGGSPMVVFHQKQLNSKGTNLLVGITQVTQDQVLEAKEMVLSSENFQKFKGELKHMIHKSHSIEFDGLYKQFETDAFTANMKDIMKEFYRTSIKTIIVEKGTGSRNRTLSVQIACPEPQFDLIKSKIQSSLECSKEKEYTFKNLAADTTAKWIQKKGNSLQLDAQGYQKELRTKFGSGIEDKSIIISGNYDNNEVKISSMTVVLDDIKACMRKYLGLPAETSPAKLSPGAPAFTPSQPSTIYPSVSNISSSTDFSTRVNLLSSSSTTISQFEQALGKGIECSMMVLAHFITYKTNCWVYGGFLRDFVVTGKSHSEMDLDIALPRDGSAGLQGVLSCILNDKAKLPSFKHQQLKGSLVLEATFEAYDKSCDFTIEIVDSVAFAKQEPPPPRVDFDVNNLKLKRSADGLSASLDLKYPGQGTVESIVNHINDRTLKLVKRPNEISARITKMRQRGWRIEY